MTTADEFRASSGAEHRLGDPITKIDIIDPPLSLELEQKHLQGVSAVNVSLTPELEQLVHDKVKTGLYQTASEVVREGLRLLQERDARLAALRRDVHAGFEAVERGDFTDYSANTVEQLGKSVKARGRRRLNEERSAGSG